jgi:phosphate transport system permease protein
MVKPANPLSTGRGGARKGESFVFGTSTALLLTIGLVFTVIIVLILNGLGFFWPGDLERLETRDGKVFLGQEWRVEEIPQPRNADGTIPEPLHRTLYRIGNRREMGGDDFVWIDDAQVIARSTPEGAIFLERMEWGPAIGRLVEIRVDGAPLPPAEVGEERFRELVGDSVAEERTGTMVPTIEEARRVGVLEIADGRRVEFPLAGVVRAVYPNDLSLAGKVGVYASRLSEFLFAEPRESNTEGGILPAILGTMLMVLVMSLIVVPLGVVAALYLNEYARQGQFVRLVRLAVSNLAGVPSIVFGMFGVSFFIYTVGKSIDGAFFADKLPAPTFGTGGMLWASLTLALLTVPVVIVSTEEALRSVARSQREGALALGATKWQSIRSVILPASLPGILTGMILAIARGAGEVAPLMLTGVVKLAPDALIDLEFPFVHLHRKFMHLGFHVYDVGFQSPSVEAAKPMVYMTALLLLVLIVVLNLTAILYRNQVRRRLQGAVF